MTTESRMRAAAIDLGKVRVGLAVADDLGLGAHPRPALDGRNTGRLLSELARLAEEERIERFIVGLPLEMTGEEGTAARRARAFAQRLADATGRAVELLDERLTSVQATRGLREAGVSEKRARKGARVDSAAAAILLQTWLDRGRTSDRDIADREEGP